MDSQLKPPKWLLIFSIAAMLCGLAWLVSGLVGGPPSMGDASIAYLPATLEQIESQVEKPAPGMPRIKQLTYEEVSGEQFPHSVFLEWSGSSQRSWHANPLTQADYDRLRAKATAHNVASVEKKVDAGTSNSSFMSGWGLTVLLILVFGAIPMLGLFQLTRALTGANGGNHGQQTVNKEVGQWIEPERLTETFEDVAGIDEVTQDLELLIEMMKDPTRLIDEFGARVPKGVLFTGGPGVGKTLCARVVAKLSGLPFFTIAGSSFEEVYVGVGAARARKMFEEAKKRGPCVIFIDEIDAVGRKRQNGPGGVGDATLNQLLVLMDGFFESAAIVIAATNRDDILDEALLRRLPWKINFPLPDQSGRLKILKVHARKKPIRQADLVHIAATTQGFSGDALRNMLNEAAITASQRTKQEQAALVAAGISAEQAKERVANVITGADLFEGQLRHLMGPARKNVAMSVDELISTAIHELWGHAFCCAYQRFKGDSKDIVRFVTIQPRSRAGGLAFITSEYDVHYHSEDGIKSQAVTAFGGSAAELEALSQKTSGIDNDFEKAYQSIHRAVTRWGMSDKVGIISVGQQGHTAATEIGVTQRDNIDEECKRIGNEMHREARRIVRMCLNSEHAWVALEDLLQNRIMVQERFAEHAAKVFQDVEAHREWDVEALDEQARARVSQRIAELATKYREAVEAAA